MKFLSDVILQHVENEQGKLGSKTKQVVSVYDVFCFKIIGKLLDALRVGNISSTKILPNVAFVF